jgi:hypothetical protein
MPSEGIGLVGVAVSVISDLLETTPEVLNEHEAKVPAVRVMVL